MAGKSELKQPLESSNGMPSKQALSPGLTFFDAESSSGAMS